MRSLARLWSCVRSVSTHRTEIFFIPKLLMDDGWCYGPVLDKSPIRRQLSAQLFSDQQEHRWSYPVWLLSLVVRNGDHLPSSLLRCWMTARLATLSIWCEFFWLTSASGWFQRYLNFKLFSSNSSMISLSTRHGRLAHCLIFSHLCAVVWYHLFYKGPQTFQSPLVQ